MKISLCMIVKDEEAVLARCLDSAASLVDEIGIVDTGSTDKTVEIAKSYAARVLFEPWQDNFAHARNISFQAATGDFLLWLDADDFVTPANAERFRMLRERLSKKPCDTVMCPYETNNLRYFRERLLRNTPEAKWRGHVHECIAPFGKILHDEFTVTHLSSGKDKSWRNLHIYQKWANEESLSGRDLFYYGRELYYHRLYAEAIAVLERMLKGDGWYVNKIEACLVLARCHMLEGNRERALSTLFQSFLFGEPRATLLCEIGKIFREKNMHSEAIYWYERAFYCRDHSSEGDFELPDCRGIIPTLELVCLYHALGDVISARFWHEKSEAIAPDHPSVIFNRNFFNSL